MSVSLCFMSLGTASPSARGTALSFGIQRSKGKANLDVRTAYLSAIQFTAVLGCFQHLQFPYQGLQWSLNVPNIFQKHWWTIATVKQNLLLAVQQDGQSERWVSCACSCAAAGHRQRHGTGAPRGASGWCPSEAKISHPTTG